MKKFFLFTFIALAFIQVNAQRNGTAPLKKGDLQLNFGTGFSNHGIPVYASLDIALHKDVTLTPQLNIKFDDDNVRFGLLAKADYHWNYLIGIPSDWDFYSGARIGIDFGDDMDVDFGIQIGGRWYFNPKWALNLELAAGTGIGTAIGVSYKL